MNLTQMLKDFLMKNCDVSKDATDEEFRAAAGDALANPEKSGLSIEKYQELTTSPESVEANKLVSAVEKNSEQLTEVVGLLKASLVKEAPSAEETKTETVEEEKKETTEEVKAPASEKKAAKYTATELQKTIAAYGNDGAMEPGLREAVDFRVKEAADRYSTERKSMVYPETNKRGSMNPMRGLPVTDMGRALSHPSDQDKALAGVWAKYEIAAVTPRIAGTHQRAFEMLSPHEKELFCYLADHTEWDASNEKGRREAMGYPGGHKQLIDDAVSGGIEAAPIVFDDQVIEVPLLFGELFPLVNVVPIERGRRIEGVATGRVTGGWGGVDATAITLFATAGYVTAFDTTIFRWEGAIQIGLDFMSDTPIDFGAHITRQYGEQLLEDLDDVIATGDGTTQPEGVINATGVALIAFGGVTSIGNYETLRFGVAKPEHKGPVANTAVYCGTETSYQRVRALPVGATDARRLFGNDHFGPNAGGYVIDGGSYRINESLTNAQVFYAVLGRYRMYRRKGFTVRTSTEGDTLIRNNELLIVVMARYGGQLERGGAAAITTTAPV